MSRVAAQPSTPLASGPRTALRVLVGLSVAHLLNDTIQAVLPAMYPMLKDAYHLNFTQIGMITFGFQVTASVLQPLVGLYTDRRPLPFSLPWGMGLTLIGIILLAAANSYVWLMVASVLVGTGSAIFHPEASRLARLASGGRHGFAQSLFQVGGNLGSSLGPLAAAAIVVPRGQAHVLWFSLLAGAAIVLLTRLGRWYQLHLAQGGVGAPRAAVSVGAGMPRAAVIRAIVVLGVLIFSKYIYLTSLTSYYTFYLISRFGVSVQHAQIYLFVFLFAVAAGTIIGGPVGDRYGRKMVIWISILGVAPFALTLPYVGLLATAGLSVIIGLVLASAFSAILVYALELVPGKVGLIAGLFFGFAFGIAGIGSAALGKLADLTSIEYVFHICSFLPLLGLFAAFLPKLQSAKVAPKANG